MPTNTNSRPFLQPDCFPFQNVLQTTTIDIHGKSERMKNAEITFMTQTISHERISQQILSLGVPKTSLKIGFAWVSHCCH